MKKIMVIVAVFCSLLPASLCFGAGSAVYSRPMQDSESVTHQWVVTCHTDGTVSAPSITGTGYDETISGIILRATIKPGTGDDAPDSSYVVKLNPTTDATIDFLGNIGAANSATVTTADTPVWIVSAFPVRLAGDIVQPYATGCGSANKFTLEIVVQKLH